MWWICKNGHSWKARIADRSCGNGCPFDSGRYAIAGETNLATLKPHLADEWDYEKNMPLTPEEVTPFTNKKVWWLCKNGHSWIASISSRASGSNCPYDSGKLPIVGETDLATCRPDLAAEWDYEKNTPLLPTQVTVGSGKAVWWKCPHGHSWKAFILNRTRRGDGCPYETGKQPRSL